MSPPIRDGSGDSIGSIRLGDGSEIAAVRTGAGDTVFSAGPPNSLLHQYIAPSFAKPWPDEIGSANMTINNGLSTTTINGESFATGDGVDDSGESSADVLGDRKTFGIALTLRVDAANVSDFDVVAGISDSSFNDILRIRHRGGDLEYNMRVNGARLSVQAGPIDDNSVHPCIINKNGNSGASDMEFYIDDMSTAKSKTVNKSNVVDHTNWQYTGDWGFFCENVGGTVEDFINADIGTIEFNSEPYTQSERNVFVSRRPEA